MAIEDTTANEQHSHGFNRAIHSGSPPSYEEKMYLPSYEKAISDLVPGFPAYVFQLEAVIKFMCSLGDYLVEQALRLEEDVLDLDKEVEQNLIHGCAIHPKTREIFTIYIQSQRIHLCLAGLRWSRIVERCEDIEWGVERVERTEYETDEENPSQIMGSRV
ncbi:uncharacterized protein EAF01_005838 [Botrytis porri]|uniref:Uncharacterized protein n=1 Tax=Botrytis porri TaxID=87229 RepID=A0A4Z1L5S6_9HELO|nr:uncharacterized protein EAF01_005838 [Botrytis porri]KAF7905317.1 hypothetical protein EAF01_005838 [Botrytis porri]TGO91853.1 hypothetical protein BPOR_0017g00350 [Botrytis porri]